MSIDMSINILIYQRGVSRKDSTPPTNGGEEDYRLIHGVLYMANEGL